MLTGVYQASKSDVIFNGKSIKGKRPYIIFEKGIARALMTKPKVLLSDEPSLGLAPSLSSRFLTLLKI